MEGGVRDDCIYKSFITSVTSARGLDVSFVCQYNDSIIFDCITSTKQKPIRFPMPLTNTRDAWELFFNEEEVDIPWDETVDVCKGAKPMK